MASLPTIVLLLPVLSLEGYDALHKRVDAAPACHPCSSVRIRTIGPLATIEPVCVEPVVISCTAGERTSVRQVTSTLTGFAAPTTQRRTTSSPAHTSVRSSASG